MEEKEKKTKRIIIKKDRIIIVEDKTTPLRNPSNLNTGLMLQNRVAQAPSSDNLNTEMMLQDKTVQALSPDNLNTEMMLQNRVVQAPSSDNLNTEMMLQDRVVQAPSPDNLNTEMMLQDRVAQAPSPDNLNTEMMLQNRVAQAPSSDNLNTEMMLQDRAVQATDSKTLSPGMILNKKYEIIREIARGGMGIVYEAYHKYMHRQVAIKIILTAEINELQFSRFQKEVDACSRLLHPNVIKIYDAGVWNSNPYLVMEYIDGVDICTYIEQHDNAYGRKRLQRNRYIKTESKERDWKLCARLIYETALGLEYIHQQKMFHRDIKPSNIMVRSNGSPVIIDLGVVKFDEDGAAKLTKSGDMIGTIGYMPIEQVKGEQNKIDAKSDVYSLGLVLYELLTEKMAYSEKNTIALVYKIISYYPPLPREINPKIPEMLEKITVHATEKQREKRYASAQEFADALSEYLNDDNPQVTKKDNNYKKRLLVQRNKKRIISFCIALLILIIVVIIGFVSTYKSPEDCYFIGKLYYDQKNYEKAREWLEKAANKGHESAKQLLNTPFLK